MNQEYHDAGSGRIIWGQTYKTLVGSTLKFKHFKIIDNPIL